MKSVTSAPVKNCINVTFMFLSVFSGRAISTYLCLFLLSFNFILCSVRTAKSTIWYILFFCWLSLRLVIIIIIIIIIGIFIAVVGGRSGSGSRGSGNRANVIYVLNRICNPSSYCDRCLCSLRTNVFGKSVGSLSFCFLFLLGFFFGLEEKWL